MRTIYLLSIIAILGISCSTQKFVSFQSPPSETFTTNKLKAFLKDNPNPKVVLRVPNAKSSATEEDANTYIYNTIEKELLKHNFIVRDRALFNEIIRKSGDRVDYSEIKKKTDTDIILELTNLEADVVYKTNEYYTSKGKKHLFGKGDISAKGIKVDFKVVLIQENEFAGNYNFNYTPCLNGCQVEDGKKGPKYYSRDNAKRQPYQTISHREMEDFFKNATNKLIDALRS